MENKTDEKVNKIQNSIMNSLANIYKKAEEIEKVDKEKSNWIIKRVEEIRNDISDNHTQPVEFLSEIMLLQTEIMNFLDSDNYKNAVSNTTNNKIEDEILYSGRQTISEEDKVALLQNRSEKEENQNVFQNNENDCTEMQIYIPKKKYFWQKIIDKILKIFQNGASRANEAN